MVLAINIEKDWNKPKPGSLHNLAGCLSVAAVRKLVSKEKDLLFRALSSHK